MANRIRGEITAQLDGRSWTLVLTLGALAELEVTFGCRSLSALLQRFSAETLSASDMIALLGAGLRGAGHAVSDEQVAMMQAPGGIAGFAAITADLLQAAFGDPDPKDGGELPEPAETRGKP